MAKKFFNRLGRVRSNSNFMVLDIVLFYVIFVLDFTNIWFIIVVVPVYV